MSKNERYVIFSISIPESLYQDIELVRTILGKNRSSFIRAAILYFMPKAVEEALLKLRNRQESVEVLERLLKKFKS